MNYIVNMFDFKLKLVYLYRSNSQEGPLPCAFTIFKPFHGLGSVLVRVTGGKAHLAPHRIGLEALGRAVCAIR